MKTFIICSEYGEILDLAIWLRYQEKQDVKMFIKSKDHQKIGDNIIEKIDDWHEYMGQDCVFIWDNCNDGKTQDWMREQGELVFGGSEMCDKLENDRQLGQDLFKKCGFNQPESRNFTNMNEAIAFIKENKSKRYILKQNSDAPKSLNHMGKFKGNEDMLGHLTELKESWDEQEYGPINFDLMEIVEGTEIAASAWWNGHDWMRNKEGKAVGFLNFEEKKEMPNGLGETCGEMGTTFVGVDEDNEYFKTILLRKPIEEYLKKAGYHGIFDVNGSWTKKGFVGFEPTCRLGIPATSYEFMEGLETKTSDLIYNVAEGSDEPIEVSIDVGMVMVIAAKPFPIDNGVEAGVTSQGEKLWYLDGDSPLDEATDKQKKHIHLENFYEDDEGDLRVATKSGYLFTVTGKGGTVESTRENLIEFIKNNVYISGNKYRDDIGKRVEWFVNKL